MTHHPPDEGRHQSTSAPASFVTPDALLDHWQGHRRLTRRVIEAFPDDRLFTFSVGSMRPFGVMVLELLAMALPNLRGVLTDSWQSREGEGGPRTREALLRRWDDDTDEIEALWPRIPASRFHEHANAFGQYEGVVHDLLLYVIDNEIHHRAQGYVYLRALGVEPPPFWERNGGDT